ncbi:membrane-associated lipoprotein involved in thiamine biosynthesis [Schinkia azotoformans MEV2011]|uniref:FAD:protein FMN transferase n=1 Tax=Schinkia azotoformans MEV2011 TaxID=1348973 RepID=A0A072NPK1_SCHAZ|nr:FAD:protein FMN transferase [Schinkia azotoformans]KEF39157.1 membrane-associated lipoprotein involved in thiamine biosynthesis [Schinkia azotoformans MEV2011]
MLMQEYYFQCKAMDTLIEIAGTGKIDLFEWEKEIENWFEQFENICSRFRPNSELSLLNNQPIDTIIQIEPTLYQIIKKANDFAAQTDFYFNPFLGKALKAYGYKETFNEFKDKNDVEIEPYQYEGYIKEPIEFLPVMNGVIKKGDYEIDLGGIAKGWSVDKVASIVKELGLENGIVNAGGDIFVWGEEERTIGVQHPSSELSDKDIIQFKMRNGGIATSNTLYRSWNVGGKRVHHILNGKAGTPSESDIVQATAFSSNTAEADVVAKILCMHNFKEAIPWLTKHFPHAGCIVVKNDGQVAISQSVKKYVTRIVM